jgi:hypothetical protein
MPRSSDTILPWRYRPHLGRGTTGPGHYRGSCLPLASSCSGPHAWHCSCH